MKTSINKLQPGDEFTFDGQKYSFYRANTGSCYGLHRDKKMLFPFDKNDRVDVKDRYVKDIPVNTEFTISGYKTVYRKVELNPHFHGTYTYGQLEVETGKVFPPTSSPVEILSW